MFKKTAAALLALIILLSFFACDTPGANGGEDSIPSQSPTLLPSAADTAQPTPTDSAIEYKKFSTKPFSRAATVSRAVLHDDDCISISANELVYIDDFAVLKLTAENKSADDLLVSDVSIYVNDCLVEVDFRHKFAAGKAEDFSLYMPILDMMLYGIREISSIDIEFRIAAASGEKYFTELTRLSAASAQPREPGAYDYSGYIAGDIAKAIHYDKLNAFNDSPGFESNGLSLASSALITVNEKYRVLLEFENAAAKPAEVNIGYIKINNLVVFNEFDHAAFRIHPQKHAVISIPLFTKAQLLLYSIGRIADVQFDITLTNENAEILSRGSASVAIPGRVGNFDFSNQYANYDENGVCMLVAGPIENFDLANKNPLILVYVKNESGKTISISSFEKCLFINGRPVECVSFSKILRSDDRMLFEIEIDAASLETELSAIWEIAVSFEISDENGNLICKPEIKLQDPSQSPITAA